MRCVIGVILVVWAVFAQPLRLYTEQLPPYNYTHQGEQKGVSVAIIRAIQSEINDTTPIEFTAWRRAYLLAQKGPNVALFSTVRLPQREKLFQWVGPIATSQMELYENSLAPTGVKSLEDAKKVESISVGSETNADTIQLRALGLTNLVINETVEQSRAIQPLVGQRTQLATGNSFTTPLMLKSLDLPIDLLVPTGVELALEQMYLVFSLDVDPQFVARWQEALDHLKQEGRMQAITEEALHQAYVDYGIFEAIP